MPLMAIAAYLFVCFIVALLAVGTRLGFFRSFIFSVMLTPFAVAIFLLLLGSIDTETKKTQHSGDVPK